MEVKVWNDNSYPYKEEYKGTMIDIAPKQFVKMQEDDAVLFLGQFNSIERDADGNPHPKSFKRLRIEKITHKDK